MTAAPGYMAVVRHCGRSSCRRLSLLLYEVRIAREWRAYLIGVVLLKGTDALSLRQALELFPQLSHDDLDALLEVGRLLTPSRP